MNIQVKPMLQLNRTATQILFKEIGIVDTLRFFSQFQVGTGDYTAERKQLFQGMSVKDIISEIREQESSSKTV
jgi:hypothetical protein